MQTSNTLYFANAAMQGSHASPLVSVRYEAPESRISGTANFSQQAISVAARGPQLTVDGTVYTSIPHFEKFKQADTQVWGSWMMLEFRYAWVCWGLL